MEVTTPGRICLFGEHQDYLGLPVIPMAVSLYSKIKGNRKQEAGDSPSTSLKMSTQEKEKEVVIHKPDLKETETFSLDDLSYRNPRDYFKSGIKVCQDEGLQFSTGFEVEVTSEIPFQAGCSSSSAIMVGWIHFLSRIADNHIDWSAQKIAELAYKAEVLEFGEPGGMMDQYSTALGGLIYLESQPEIQITPMNSLPGAFVLGDSREKKNTLEILQRCKNNRLEILNKLKINDYELNLHSIKITDSANLTDLFCENEMDLLRGTIKNRDILSEALVELQSENPNYELVGKLLTDHHAVLRDVLKVSTPKIEKMLDAALAAGALGGKINGSGGGGCMFAFAPENPEVVAEAIEKVGGTAHIVESVEGTKVVTS